jgi:hypothetical protein
VEDWGLEEVNGVFCSLSLSVSLVLYKGLTCSSLMIVKSPRYVYRSVADAHRLAIAPLFSNLTCRIVMPSTSRAATSAPGHHPQAAAPVETIVLPTSCTSRRFPAGNNRQHD